MTDTELLKEVKEFLRIDGDDHDSNLTGLIVAAKEYIKGATGKEYSGLPLETLCLKLIMTHWFDQETRQIPHGVNSILTQLQYS